MSTARLGVCFRSCASPSQGINLILDMRTVTMSGATNGFALSLADWRQKLAHGVKTADFDHFHVPIKGIRRKVLSSIQMTPSGIAVTSRDRDVIYSRQIRGIHASVCVTRQRLDLWQAKCKISLQTQVRKLETYV